MVVLDKIIIKIVEQYLKYYLSNFDKKSLKLGFLSGEMSLENMEVNPQFLKDMMLVQNLTVRRVVVNKIVIKIPWKNMMNEPISMALDTVECDIYEGFSYEPPKKKKPTSYGFIGRCFDGVKIQIKQIYTNIVTYDGIPNNPISRNIRVSLTNMEVFSTNADWERCEMKDVFVQNKEKTSVIFYKKFQCSSMSFSFLVNNPITKSEEWVTPLANLPLDINIRIKREISDGDVLCGEIGLVFDDMNITFREFEWHSLFELLKGLVASFTKKTVTPTSSQSAPNVSSSSHARDSSPSTPIINSQMAEEKVIQDIPLEKVLAELHCNNNNNNDDNNNDGNSHDNQNENANNKFSNPHVWVEPKKEFVLEESEWGLVKSDRDEFNQTRFTIRMNRGKLTMAEDDSTADAPKQFSLFLFEDLLWSIHLSPYEFRKRKAIERAKQLKKKKPTKPKAASSPGSVQDAPIIRKKLGEMRMSLGKIFILGEAPERTALLSQLCDDGKSAINLMWLIRTEQPEEQDITVWLRSLIIDMYINLSNINIIFERKEWFRILNFFNLTSTASALSDATSSVIFRLHGEALNSHFTLTDRTKYIEKPRSHSAVANEGDHGSGAFDPPSCLKMHSGRVVFGSDIEGVQRNEVFDSGIFQRYVSQNVAFPADADDFTYGIRFVNAVKPRRFQFMIENTSAYIDDCMIMDPSSFHVEFRLQKFFDKEKSKISGENLIAHVVMNDTSLSITPSQYSYFYKTLFHLWDDLKLEFIPSLSKFTNSALISAQNNNNNNNNNNDNDEEKKSDDHNNDNSGNQNQPQNDDFTMTPYTDLIPTHIPAFANKIKVAFYDDDIIPLQIKKKDDKDIKFPPPPIAATVENLQFVSNIFASQKIACFAIKLVEIRDESFPLSDVNNEGSDNYAVSGRFVFKPDDMESSSTIKIEGLKCNISKKNLELSQKFIKMQNDGMSRRKNIIDEKKHVIEFHNCVVNIDEQQYDGFPPELVHLLKEVIPFWR